MGSALGVGAGEVGHRRKGILAEQPVHRAWRSEPEGALGRPGSWPREPRPGDRAGMTLVVGGQCGRGAGDGRRVPVGGLEEQAAPTVGRCHWGGRVQPPTAWRGHPEAGSAGRHPVQHGVIDTHQQRIRKSSKSLSKFIHVR
ncbi:hypothetical protein EI555_002517 [Monodon monoceros]|uniref:Uncharacterized protein n=1 Tax=Monodon monoceros TaxID=40151 RepID=A0A4U1FIR0_MONMO|nr:hypothetical protein EI555_002517 [Monodon monoceros]